MKKNNVLFIVIYAFLIASIFSSCKTLTLLTPKTMPDIKPTRLEPLTFQAIDKDIDSRFYRSYAEHPVTLDKDNDSRLYSSTPLTLTKPYYDDINWDNPNAVIRELIPDRGKKPLAYCQFFLSKDITLTPVNGTTHDTITIKSTTPGILRVKDNAGNFVDDESVILSEPRGNREAQTITHRLTIRVIFGENKDEFLEFTAIYVYLLIDKVKIDKINGFMLLKPDNGTPIVYGGRRYIVTYNETNKEIKEAEEETEEEAEEKKGIVFFGGIFDKKKKTTSKKKENPSKWKASKIVLPKEPCLMYTLIKDL